MAGGRAGGALWGHLVYQDKAKNLAVKGTGDTITGPRSRHIEGNADIGGAAGTYALDVVDNSRTTSPDTFAIRLSTGYGASGPLGGGDITLNFPAPARERCRPPDSARLRGGSRHHTGPHDGDIAAGLETDEHTSPERVIGHVAGSPRRGPIRPSTCPVGGVENRHVAPSLVGHVDLVIDRVVGQAVGERARPRSDQHGQRGGNRRTLATVSTVRITRSASRSTTSIRTGTQVGDVQVPSPAIDVLVVET
ncbi:MAG: hypothetical protein LC713_00910 [Actinobacteria bacterium]|nr:hypothetical protein [Actinomycetota bacterium]